MKTLPHLGWVPSATNHATPSCYINYSPKQKINGVAAAPAHGPTITTTIIYSGGSSGIEPAWSSGSFHQRVALLHKKTPTTPIPKPKYANKHMGKACGLDLGTSTHPTTNLIDVQWARIYKIRPTPLYKLVIPFDLE